MYVYASEMYMRVYMYTYTYIYSCCPAIKISLIN